VEIISMAIEAKALGAGKTLLNSVDKDGSKSIDINRFVISLA
jgi:imidazole glycerol phosphate synthase subunit HisF